MLISKSYERCDCNADCYKLDENKNEPCWGKVYPIDEIVWEDDSSWVHCCVGHWECYDGGEYKKEISV